MTDKKIYVGKGKKKSDTWLKVSINPDKLAEYVKEYEGKKYVKLDINIGKADQYGKDVQISIDTWEPTGSSKQEGSDLPF